MKKIIYILALAVAFAACNKETLGDIYDSIPDRPYSKSVDYTLSDNDYVAISKAATADGTNKADIVEPTLSLNSSVTPNKYVPAVLATRFRGLQKTSTVTASYNYTEDYVFDLEAAPSYTLVLADYQIVSGSSSTTAYFESESIAEQSLPAIMAAKYHDASSGEIVLVTYSVADWEGDTERVENAIYLFSSTWKIFPNATILDPADYTAMGVTQLSVNDTKTYIPIYLGLKYPYAQSGDKVAVVYKTSATANGAVEYQFADGKWVKAFKSAQFIHSGEGGWLFDPTVNITMTAADHQLVVTYVLNDPILGVYRSSYSNEEFYYGFNAHYVNVSFRLSYRATYAATDPDLLNKTDDDKIVVLWTRLKNEGMPLFLALKYPDAVTNVQGIPVMYNITADVFYPDGVTYQAGTTKYPYTFTYKVLTNGSAGVAPTFEFVDVVSLAGSPIF